MRCRVHLQTKLYHFGAIALARVPGPWSSFSRQGTVLAPQLGDAAIGTGVCGVTFDFSLLARVAGT
jgi:hypothetical protein